MRPDRILLACLLAAAFAGGALLLRRSLSSGAKREWAKVVAAAFGMLAAVFLLKTIPEMAGPSGLLRDDFLFPLWALREKGDAWWWYGPAIAVVAGFAILARTGALFRMRETAFLGSVIGGLAVLWTALSLTNGGWPEGLVWPFERNADYLVNILRFSSFAEIGSTWVERQESLSLHARTHPPGAVALLYLLSRALGGRIEAVALATVLLAALAAVPIHLWARNVLGERGARIAVLSWGSIPAVTLYGATCMDALFVLVLVVPQALFFSGRAERIRDRGALSRALGRGSLVGLFLAGSFLLTFSSAILAVSFAVVAAADARGGAVPRRNAIAEIASAGAVCLLVLASLDPLAGFDVFECLRTAIALDGAEAPAFLSAGYYGLTRLMGALDFLLLAGLGTVPWALSAAMRPSPEERPSAIPARALLGTLAAFLLLGAFKIGETGRIGLFLMPAVALAATARMASSERAVAAAIGLNLILAFGLEAFLDTRW